MFDIIATLQASRFSNQEVQHVLKKRLVQVLTRRAGLLPPSECMLTLHELIHVCDQVYEVGTPRVSSLYKFERMNHILKELLKNKARGSIIAVYCYLLTYYCYL